MALSNADFTRDPIGFLTRTAIAMDYTNCVAGVNQIVIEDQGAEVVKMLRLKKPADASGIAAYFLPYSDGAVHQLTLGNAANYFFTPPLTGCSFFLDKQWWSPTVSHINMQTAEGGIDQPAINASAAGVHGQQFTGLKIVSNYYSLKKDDYTPLGQSPQDNRVYIIGVLGKLGWYIYKMKHDPMTNTVIEAPTRIN